MCAGLWIISGYETAFRYITNVHHDRVKEVTLKEPRQSFFFFKKKQKLFISTTVPLFYFHPTPGRNFQSSQSHFLPYTAGIVCLPFAAVYPVRSHKWGSVEKPILSLFFSCPPQPSNQLQSRGDCKSLHSVSIQVHHHGYSASQPHKVTWLAPPRLRLCVHAAAPQRLGNRTQEELWSCYDKSCYFFPSSSFSNRPQLHVLRQGCVITLSASLSARLFLLSSCVPTPALS